MICCLNNVPIATYKQSIKVNDSYTVTNLAEGTYKSHELQNDQIIANLSIKDNKKKKKKKLTIIMKVYFSYENHAKLYTRSKHSYRCALRSPT